MRGPASPAFAFAGLGAGMFAKPSPHPGELSVSPRVNK